MFGMFFGWSKASKCKRAIKRTQYRLRLLKNKTIAIATQLRKDLTQLIRSGYEEAAFNRAGQLMEDESMAAVYELLDHFCESILKQLSYIRKHKDCPSEISEAVSSLIFASARCGDLPELCIIRKLFGERYGHKFATTALELLPGNLVNKKLKENLCTKSIPDDLKYKVVDEIAKDNCLQQQILAIEWKQVKENKGYQLNGAKINDTILGSKVHPLEIEETKRDVKCVNSSSLAATAIVSTVQQYPPYSPLQNKVQQEEEVDFTKLLSSMNSNKEEKLAFPSSAERKSSTSYIDDIEDCQFSLPENGASKILFNFKSSGMSIREKTQYGSEQSDIDQEELPSETSSIRISRRRKRTQRKRSRRKSACLDKPCIMDIGYITYYQNPSKSSPSPHKHQKPSKNVHSTSSHSKDSTRRITCNMKIGGCSLNQPCHCCFYDDEGLETQPNKPERGNIVTHVQQGLIDEFCHCQPFWDDEMNKGMEVVTITQKPNGKSYIGENECHVDCEAGNGNSEIQEKISSPSLSRIETEGTYTRAMTMPLERHKNSKDKMLRTFSCPSPNPNHVHPKLPDYDDLAAKFNALKREHLENKEFRGVQVQH